VLLLKSLDFNCELGLDLLLGYTWIVFGMSEFALYVSKEANASFAVGSVGAQLSSVSGWM